MTVRRILRANGWKPYVPTLVHSMNEADPFRRIEFCRFFLRMCQRIDSLVDLIVWSDEATFKLSGTINRHNCVYWAQNNPNIVEEETVNSPGITVCRGLSSRGLLGPFFFEGTVTGTTYLRMLEERILPAIRDLYEGI